MTNQEAVEILKILRSKILSGTELVAVNMAIDSLNEQKFGAWVYDPDGMDWNIPAWRCSECKQKNDMIPTYIVNVGVPRNPYIYAGSQYCPNCGAKMGK